MRHENPRLWLRVMLLLVTLLIAMSLPGAAAMAEPSAPSVSCLGEDICAGFPQDVSLRSRALANEVLAAVAALPEQEQRFFLEKRRNAKGFAIFPSVQKGGIMGASIFGRGVLSVREDDGSWTPPVLLTLEGQSVGPQVGMQSSNVLFLFHTICSVKDFLSGHHHLSYAGSGCSIVHVDHPGPETDEPTDITIHVFERGVVIGQSVDRYSVHIDEESNAALYGVKVRPSCMLDAVRGGLSLPWMLRYLEKMGRPSDQAHSTYTSGESEAGLGSATRKRQRWHGGREAAPPQTEKPVGLK